MKKLIVFLILMSLSVPCFAAQRTDILDVTGNTTLANTTGNVGIGTSSPATLLDVNSKLNVTTDGNVGIGNNNPAFSLDVNGNVNVVGNITTSLATGKCVETDSSGMLTAAADACGTGTGGGAATSLTLTDASLCTWSVTVSTTGALITTNVNCPGAGNSFIYGDANNFIFGDGNNFVFGT